MELVCWPFAGGSEGSAACCCPWDVDTQLLTPKVSQAPRCVPKAAGHIHPLPSIQRGIFVTFRAGGFPLSVAFTAHAETAVADSPVAPSVAPRLPSQRR